MRYIQWLIFFLVNCFLKLWCKDKNNNKEPQLTHGNQESEIRSLEIIF